MDPRPDEPGGIRTGTPRGLLIGARALHAGRMDCPAAADRGEAGTSVHGGPAVSPRLQIQRAPQTTDKGEKHMRGLPSLHTTARPSSPARVSDTLRGVYRPPPVPVSGAGVPLPPSDGYPGIFRGTSPFERRPIAVAAIAGIRTVPAGHGAAGAHGPSQSRTHGKRAWCKRRYLCPKSCNDPS